MVELRKKKYLHNVCKKSGIVAFFTRIALRIKIFRLSCLSGVLTTEHTACQGTEKSFRIIVLVAGKKHIILTSKIPIVHVQNKHGNHD